MCRRSSFLSWWGCEREIVLLGLEQAIISNTMRDGGQRTDGGCLRWKSSNFRDVPRPNSTTKVTVLSCRRGSELIAEFPVNNDFVWMYATVLYITFFYFCQNTNFCIIILCTIFWKKFCIIKFFTAVVGNLSNVMLYARPRTLEHMPHCLSARP